MRRITYLTIENTESMAKATDNVFRVLKYYQRILVMKIHSLAFKRNPLRKLRLVEECEICILDSTIKYIMVTSRFTVIPFPPHSPPPSLYFLST